MRNMEKYINLINQSQTKEELWDVIESVGLDYQKSLKVSFRKNTGIFYTGLELANVISKKLITHLKRNNKPIHELKLLEPCVGIGNFVFSYLKLLAQTKLTTCEIHQLINNIYVCDIDVNALLLYQNMFTKFVYLYFNVSLDDNYFQTHIISNLSFNLNKNEVKYTSFNDVFYDKISKFDVVITNPPYKNLKADSDKYDNEEDFKNSKIKYKQISDYVKKNFQYANEGVLNMYKIFVEDIICNYTNEKAVISLLIPNTILTDKSCTKLRNLILEENRLSEVLSINETDKNIDAQQAMVSILIEKGFKKTQTINYEEYPFLEKKKIDYISIKKLSMSNAIYLFSEDELNRLYKLNTFPKLKTLKYIINKRGELDLTFHKKYISDIKTPYPLIRGKHISSYFFNMEPKEQYVKEEFLSETKKSEFIKNPRIACQQISNINCKKRLKFVLIEKGHILANSCNFISIKKNHINLDCYALLGILNSNLLNWYFKVFSSNNHINNYELDEIPIPTNKEIISEISANVQLYIKTKNDSLLEIIENLVENSYMLNNNIDTSKTNKMMRDLEYIHPSLKEMDVENIDAIKKYIKNSASFLDSFELKTIEKIFEKYTKLSQNCILNHTSFKLSDLDMEMIVNIPQGGNWKNIPDNIIQKSERLKKIKKTGGRTTLYGRLNYNKPSYTITTYFNRPGNGTYVHPIHNRVISIREAARFQSFCDDYFFVGSKTDILNQVGNAVPPLLAFQIAQKIKDKIDVNCCVDLFCGAGGMSQGFKHAGIRTVMGVDFDKSACLTYKINNPEINTICGDLTNTDLKEHIINISKTEQVDLICGGPPCQGFSMAGKRFIDDPRNKLFKEYLYLVENIQPKIFVFENVEGILTFQSGTVYREILKEFSNIGYNVVAKKLKATDYAVPQKRKRIIIIGVRSDINVKPEDCYPEPIISDEKYEISSKNAISDLEKIECNENAKYEHCFTSSYVKTLKKEMSFSQFIMEIKNAQTEVEKMQLSLF